MAINLKKEADLAGAHPSRRFGKRERKMLESVAAELPFKIVKAAKHTHAGGTEATISDASVQATDVVIAQLESSANDASVVKCTAGAGSVVVDFGSTDPGASVIQYIVVRALA